MEYQKAVTTGLIVGGVVAYALTMILWTICDREQTHQWQSEAIDCDAAEFIVIDNYGATEFRWLNEVKEVEDGEEKED